MGRVGLSRRHNHPSGQLDQIRGGPDGVGRLSIGELVDAVLRSVLDRKQLVEQMGTRHSRLARTRQ